jgi:hypothetical protein
MNSPFVSERAANMAARLEEASSSAKEQIDEAFLLCFGRRPLPEEQQRSLAFLKPRESSEGSEDKPYHSVLTRYCQALLCTAEFRNLD